MVAVRLPTVARQILTSLDINYTGGCLEELQEAARTRGQLRLGARPPPVDAERGEWQHGWQYPASSVSEHHFRETVIFATGWMRCSDAPPFNITDETCACGAELDTMGRHRAAGLFRSVENEGAGPGAFFSYRGVGVRFAPPPRRAINR